MLFLFLLLGMLQLVQADDYFKQNLDYPPLFYNKNDISDKDIARFRQIMSSIPEEWFDNVEYIKVTNKEHISRNWTGQITCKGYKCHFILYELKYLTDDEITELLLHEIGHKVEFRDLIKHNSLRDIFKRGLSESYAEEWRIEKGGNPLQSYSSKR